MVIFQASGSVISFWMASAMIRWMAIPTLSGLRFILFYALNYSIIIKGVSSGTEERDKKRDGGGIIRDRRNISISNPLIVLTF